MFTLTLRAPVARSFRVRKSSPSSAWRVAVALSKRHHCAVDVTDDAGEYIGQATA